jgi:hypothetical protein
MTPSTKRKLARGPLGAVFTCPQCAKAFVQRQFPRTFCSRACGKAHWRQEQARFLEAGSKHIAEYVAQGLNDQADAETLEAIELFDSLTSLPTDAEFDQWLGLATSEKEEAEETVQSKIRSGNDLIRRGSRK